MVTSLQDGNALSDMLHGQPTEHRADNKLTTSQSRPCSGATRNGVTFTIFWEVTQNGPADRYQDFGEVYCLHLQGTRRTPKAELSLISSLITYPTVMMEVLTKCRHLSEPSPRTIPEVEGFPQSLKPQMSCPNNKLRGLRPRANYTDRATAACRHS
jgi:hypothetical protein